jgi:DNA-3-methyladenine glycosylase
LRAGEVLSDPGLAHARRPTARRDADLARGPARLAALLGIGREQYGLDLTDPASPVRLYAGEPVPSSAVRSGPRVGVAAAATLPWRFWVDGSPAVSPYRPAVARPRRNQLAPGAG